MEPGGVDALVFHPKIVRSQPMRQDGADLEEIGVIPSPSDTTELWLRTGNTGAYRHMFVGPFATSSCGSRLLLHVPGRKRTSRWSTAFAQVVDLAGLAPLSAHACIPGE